MSPRHELALWLTGALLLGLLGMFAWVTFQASYRAAYPACVCADGGTR